MLEEDVSEAERKDFAAQLAASGDALLEMFVEILEDTTAEKMTEHDIDLEAFDIHALVDKLAKLKKPSLTHKGLDFISAIDPNTPTFLVSDRRKIHRIVLNLIGNAVKFTQKGHIALNIALIEKQDPQVTLKFSVIDTGIGISKKDQEHLFDRLPVKQK